MGNKWVLKKWENKSIFHFTTYSLTLERVWSASVPVRLQFWMVGPVRLQFWMVGPVRLQFWMVGPVRLQFWMVGPVRLQFWMVGPVRLQFWLVGPVRLQFWMVGPVRLQFLTCGRVGAFCSRLSLTSSSQSILHCFFVASPSFVFGFYLDGREVSGLSGLVSRVHLRNQYSMEGVHDDILSGSRTVHSAYRRQAWCHVFRNQYSMEGVHDDILSGPRTVHSAYRRQVCCQISGTSAVMEGAHDVIDV